jgi:hypothetical protein
MNHLGATVTGGSFFISIALWKSIFPLSSSRDFLACDRAA